MGALLARRWFLLLLLAGVALAASCPAVLRPWADRLPPRAVVALTLFLMACGLESRRLFRSLTRPLPALWATAVGYTALPALGWLAGRILPVPDYRVGLFLIACVPCTLASAVLWTRMAGGDEGTALVGVILTTATSWLFTTAWLTAGTDVLVSRGAPHLMADLLTALVLPVAAGQLARAVPRLARLADRWRKPREVLVRLLILSMVVKAAVGVASEVGRRSTGLAPGPLLGAGLLCLAVHLAGHRAALWSSRALGFDRGAQIAVAFTASQKTLPVALFLYEAHFREAYPLAVLPVVIYHVGQLVLDTFAADHMARLAPPEPPAVS